MNTSKRYYVDLQDGFIEGDIYLHKNEIYEVIKIDACNQMMEVEEITENSKKN